MPKIEKLDNPELCKALIEAYRMRDYYGEMCEIADNKINALTIKMSWSDIKYCIRKGSN
jgi:hypothetical protein